MHLDFWFLQKNNTTILYGNRTQKSPIRRTIVPTVLYNHMLCLFVKVSRREYAPSPLTPHRILAMQLFHALTLPTARDKFSNVSSRHNNNICLVRGRNYPVGFHRIKLSSRRSDIPWGIIRACAISEETFVRLMRICCPFAEFCVTFRAGWLRRSLKIDLDR